jgi:hypothetical protein
VTPIRRVATVATTTALLIGTLSSTANAETLSDYLDRAHESTFTANRLVVSVWGGETQISKSFVEHADGTEMVRVDSTWSLVGNGRGMTVGESSQGVAFMTTEFAIETDRYSIGETRPARHMGRICTVVPVYEGELLRAMLLVDNNTGAPLITETYREDGTLFRRTSLQDFRAYRTYEAPSDPAARYEILMPVESDLLPDEIAGYRLLDAFPAPADSAQGFYSDGLFTFSLFVFAAGTPLTGLEDPMPFITGTGTYDARPTADDVRITWSGPDNEYVLVGDLPPDHAGDVLAELPAPDARSVFARWWQRLFG